MQIIGTYVRLVVLIIIASTNLTSCDGTTSPLLSYSVSGTVSGLTGVVVLQNNGADDLSLSANGAFAFAAKVIDGTQYNVSVKAQPADQTCVVGNNSGTIAGKDISNVSLVCSTKQWQGTKQFGAAGKDVYARGIAVDASGSVYVAGDTGGDLDGNVLTGTRDLFVTKYNSTGSKVWTKQFGVPGQWTGANSVAVDVFGNIYAAGGTAAQAAGTGTVIVKMYDATGNEVRTSQFGATGKDAGAMSIAVDASGNVYAAGCTTGGLDGNTQAGYEDFFVTTYDPAGTRVRTRQLGVPGKGTYGRGVAVDSAGNVYVTGDTTGGLDGNVLAGSFDVFLTKYDSSGNKVFTMQLGANGASTIARSIALDSAGNAYVAGYTNGGLVNNTLTGTWDAFIAKYDSSGIMIWIKQYGVSGVASEAYGVAVDSADRVNLVGYSAGGLNGNIRIGDVDSFVITVDKLGNLIRVRQFGVPGFATYANGVAANAGNEVFVTGTTYGGLDSNVKIGNMDSYITKYDSTGVKQ